MTWLSQNWLWLLAGAAFAGLHVVGYRGHGGHGDADPGASPQHDKRVQGRLAPARARSREPSRRSDR